MENINNIIYQARFCLKSNWIQAVNILENALKTNPEAEEIYLELADIYFTKSAFKKTLEYYQKALKVNPNNSFSRFKIGNIYLELDEPKLAIYHYDKITEDYPEALYNKAIAYRGMQKHDEAIKTLKELINHPVKMINAYRYLVEILVMFGKTKEAFRYINDAAAVFGDVCLIHYLKGVVFFREKNFLSSYYEYTLAARDDTEYPHIHRVLSRLAIAIGMVPNAYKHLKDAIRLHKNDRSAVSELVELLLTNQIVSNKDELIEYFKDFDDNITDTAISFYDRLIKKGVK